MRLKRGLGWAGRRAHRKPAVVLVAAAAVLPVCHGYHLVVHSARRVLLVPRARVREHHVEHVLEIPHVHEVWRMVPGVTHATRTGAASLGLDSVLVRAACRVTVQEFEARALLEQSLHSLKLNKCYLGVGLSGITFLT